MTDAGSGPGGSAQDTENAVAERAAELATEVTEAEQPQERRRLAAAFAAAARSGARVTGRGLRAAGRGGGGGRGGRARRVVPRPARGGVRTRGALGPQSPGQPPEETAAALIPGASRASAAVGGAVGAWSALRVLPAFPAE